jgi:hypothetical protein
MSIWAREDWVESCTALVEDFHGNLEIVSRGVEPSLAEIPALNDQEASLFPQSARHPSKATFSNGIASVH